MIDNFVASKTKPLKILIVEDEPLAMIINRKMLEEIGYTPDIAENGKQALAMAVNDYDVIFMDIGLPDINGFEVAIEIRRCEGSQKHTHIIALTAYTLGEIRNKCFAAGMDEVLAKPIKATKLQEMIEKFC